MTEIIQLLENNIQKLLKKLVQLESDYLKLHQKSILSDQKIEEQNKEIGNLKNELESLKLANTLLGSDENKRQTKLKINLLIREIDYCIAELSE